MPTGTDILHRIDEVTKERHESRGAMCENLKITRSTLSSWNSNNCFPKVDIIAKIADYLKISINWLVNGYLYSPKEDQTQQDAKQTVWSKIYQLLPPPPIPVTFPFGMSINDPEPHIVLITSLQHCKHMTNLHKIVDYWTLYNWSKCRCELPYWSFESIAFSLNTSVQSLFSNEPISNGSSINKELYSLALENKEELICFSQLNQENKVKIKALLEDTYKLQNFENRN